jgi:ABC-type nitrate/sulfonate/bicarbonate transport system permease component
MFDGLSKTIARYLASLLLLVLTWEILVRALAIPLYILPLPETILSTLWREQWFFLNATRFTVTNMLLGATLGITAGVMVGALVAYSKTLRWLVEPYLIIFQSFPREALFPLLIVWLGFGMATKVVNAGLLSFFPMAVITLNGLLDVRHDYVDLIRSWGANRGEEFLYCRLPTVIPTLVSAIKVCLPLALIGAVLGEFMGGNSGLGYIIISSTSASRTDRIFAAIVILAGVGLLMLSAIQLAQRAFLERYNQE